MIDTFTREVSSGLGTSEIDDLPWSTFGIVPSGVSGGEAHWETSELYTSDGYGDSVSTLSLGVDQISLPFEMRFALRVEKAETADFDFSVALWKPDPPREWAEVLFGGAGAGALDLAVRDSRGTHGDSVPSGIVGYSSGDRIEVRVVIDAEGTHARAWFATEPEPTEWHESVTGAGTPAFEILELKAMALSPETARVFLDDLEIIRGYKEPQAPPCADEQQLTEYEPRNGADIPIRVRVDPRFIVPENRADFEAEAARIVEALQFRAEYALLQYQSLDIQIPDDVTLEIVCDIKVVLGPLTIFEPPEEVNGFAEARDLVKLRARFIREAFKSAVRNGFPDADAWTPAEGWVNLLDHEMFHTTQHMKYVWNLFLGQDRDSQAAVLIESSAVAAQDLIDDADDLAPPDRNLPFAESYLFEVEAGLRLLPSVAPGPHSAVDEGAGADAYHAGAAFQYWGERFGDGETIEHRIAKFIDGLLPHYGNPIPALRRAMSPTDPFDALRDYYLTLYALQIDASNVSPTLNRTWQLLDRDVAHGGVDGVGDGTPYPEVTVLDEALPADLADTLDGAQGRIYDFDLPIGTRWARVALTNQPADGQSATSDMHAAFVPASATDVLLLSRARMPTGQFRDGSPAPSFVNVVAANRLAIVVTTSDHGSNYRLEVEPLSGASGVELLAPTASAPDDYGVLQHAEIPIEVRPLVGTTFASGLAASDFAVRIGGEGAAVRRIEPRADRYVLFVEPDEPLLEGSHGVEVRFDGVAATEPGAIQIVPPLPGAPPEPSPESSAAGSLGTLDVGESATASAYVSSGTQLGRFRIGWPGSEFDLSLTSPSGRVITEDTTDPDISVDEQPTTVTIDIESPEPGEWELTATGIEVPAGPEPVSYAVEEFDTPLRAGLTVSTGGEAGLPLSISAGLAGASGPLPDAVVRATITDPVGVVRSWPLPDADPLSGLTGDGLFGAEVWAMSLPGTYSIRVEAIGTLDGLPVSRVETSTVELTAMADADLDAVADAVEPRFGLDPTNPADGLTDHDRDGLGVADELAAGTDPNQGDSDFGGENDRSELDAGRDPRLSSDDAEVPGVWISVTPRDDNLIAVAAATGDATGTVRLLQIDATGAETEIGNVAGEGGEIVDGPLPDGEYLYVGVAIASTGAEGEPAIVGPYSALADPTRPSAGISVAGNRYATNDATVQVRFTDLSERVLEMRLATSRSELEDAPWEPFEATFNFSLPEDEGTHTVYAQVADAAGNTSPVLHASVDLDTELPSSQAGALDLLHIGESVQVPFVASDSLDVAAVELWVRHRASELHPWGEWELASVRAASPFTYAAAYGDGIYEFFTVALDDAGNREDDPASADAATRVVLSGAP